MTTPTPCPHMTSGVCSVCADLAAAMQLLSYAYDRFGPPGDGPADVAAFREKWEAIFPDNRTFWKRVSALLTYRVAKESTP